MTAKQLDSCTIHFDKDERARHKHSNVDINVLYTNLNYDIEDSYKESLWELKSKVKEYDKIKPPRKKFGYDKRVIAIALEVICPDEIANLYEGAEDDFFQTIYKCEKLFFGKNLVCYGGVHKDEIHTYINTKTNKLENSRAHLHTFIIPYTEEYGVNGREFATREKYRKFNKYCDSAIFNQFKIHLNTFAGRNDWGNVESLKRESENARVNLKIKGKDQTKEYLIDSFMKENTDLKQQRYSNMQRFMDVMFEFREYAPKPYKNFVSYEYEKYGFESIITKIAKNLSIEEYGNWHKDPMWAELEREEEERKKKRKKEEIERYREI